MPQLKVSSLTEERQKQLRSIAYWANKMDSQWSIFGVPVGWDALLGLLPVAGDAIASCISLAIVNKARKMGIPKRLVLRMLANVLVDFLGGSVPVLGDLFDVSWRANSKNLQLLEQHYKLNKNDLGVTSYAVYLLLGMLLIGAVLAVKFYFAGY